MNERHGALPTAHGPDCASATHAGHSPPRERHSQRRGPLPKLLWADLFSIISLGMVNPKYRWFMFGRPFLPLWLNNEATEVQTRRTGCPQPVYLTVIFKVKKANVDIKFWHKMCRNWRTDGHTVFERGANVACTKSHMREHAQLKGQRSGTQSQYVVLPFVRIKDLWPTYVLSRGLDCLQLTSRSLTVAGLVH